MKSFLFKIDKYINVTDAFWLAEDLESIDDEVNCEFNDQYTIIKISSKQLTREDIEKVFDFHCCPISEIFYDNS
ncbi:hypothetical protein A9P82_04520 [Arachidicoccus ginsenosidimutans]|nr:hypothetical protein A9P82_04520 [Arachidicoccus sp. BS20]